MSIGKHIGSLLYEHDCVIVPEFGGFVANYQPAKVNPAKHTFTPPSKSVIFNRNLKNNDGLLASYIATLEKTNYTQALRHIDQFVGGLNEQLKKGTKVKIDEVGTLYLDVERNVQFEPESTNFLLDAFGLSEFQSPAIKRDTIAKRIEKEFKDRDAIPVEKKKINTRRLVALAIAAPLLFAMVWIPLKTDLLKNVNYSDLNPFSSKEVKIPEVKNRTPVSNDTTHIKVVVYDTINRPVAAQLIAADTTHVETNTAHLDLRFHVVAGCFQIEENAINYVKTLKEQNLDAAIIGQNNKGLYVVSCGDYPTRKAALNGMQELKKQQPNVWLYRN
ncbi:MAG: SPOR domain-containing protein [Bacteroidia bacterium]